MQKLNRNINIGFRVNESEHNLIRSRMREVGIRNTRAYLLKMALNGYILHLDLTDVRECSRLLRILGNNVNQLARKANEGGGIYGNEIIAVQTGLSDIRSKQDKIIRSLANVIKAS
ncbi:MAG: plasmid mobilization relaxosome protein MobC [Oscillospiraceae bacterium]|nr:plasmid mobilization relaxosome protein MobC [Oscillospiraceae bacterium]